MKKFILTTLLFVSTIMANDVTVEITDILNKNATVYIGLYDKSDDFTIVSKNYRGVIVEVVSDSLTYTFKDIPDGTYAISIFHDENSNKELDKNFFGVPSEGYGFSNNIRPIFRSANFDESKFMLNRDMKFVIKMGY